VTMTRPPAVGPAPQPPRPGTPSGPRIAGIPVRITPGGYLLGVLAAGFSALTLPSFAPGHAAISYLAAAAALVIILLGSLLGHELAHALAARRYGGSAVAAIGFFGGLSHGRADLTTARAQWRVAAAGPVFSLLLAGLSLAALAGLSGAGPLPAAVATTAVWINGLLAVANLVPGAGLDGGRIVRAVAWARSGDPTRAGLIAARFGQVTGAVLTAAGITTVVLGHLIGLWVGLMGLLILAASRAEASQVITSAALAGLRVRDILPARQGAAPAARGWQSVQGFLDGGAESGPGSLAQSTVTAYPVRDFDGDLQGVVTLSQLQAVPPARREVTRLSQVATPVEQVVVSTLDEPLTELRSRLNVRPASPAALHTAGHALVLDAGGELAGLITPADFARAAQFGALRSGAGLAGGLTGRGSGRVG
jgi:Zn-dependent protease